MSAASLPEWLAAFAIGAALYVPGALLILSLDHDLTAPARALSAPLSPRRLVRVLVRIVRRQPAPRRLPYWARTGHVSSSPSTAAKGRHRRGVTR